MAEEAEAEDRARRILGYIGVLAALVVVIVGVGAGIATGAFVLWLAIGAALGFAIGALTAWGQQRWE
ncbi:MAG: hypothetical protein ACE5KQ_06405 [Thermoplasmata archaeon]